MIGWALFRSAWVTRTLDYRSPLSPDACIERLKAVTETATRYTVSDKPLKGWVHTRTAWLTWQTPYQKPFASLADVRLSEDGAGSRVTVEIGVAKVLRVLMLVCFACLGVLLLLSALTLIGLVIALPLCAAAYAGTAFWRADARDEEELMLDTIEATLNTGARPA